MSCRKMKRRHYRKCLIQWFTVCNRYKVFQIWHKAPIGKNLINTCLKFDSFLTMPFSFSTNNNNINTINNNNNNNEMASDTVKHFSDETNVTLISSQQTVSFAQWKFFLRILWKSCTFLFLLWQGEYQQGASQELSRETSITSECTMSDYTPENTISSSTTSSPPTISMFQNIR